MTGRAARVLATAAAVESERDYLLGLLLEQGRVMAAQWSTTFDPDGLRESLLRRARVRPGTDGPTDRLRALGRGDLLTDPPDPRQQGDPS